MTNGLQHRWPRPPSATVLAGGNCLLSPNDRGLRDKWLSRFTRCGCPAGDRVESNYRCCGNIWSTRVATKSRSTTLPSFNPPKYLEKQGAPETTRTSDQRFRKPLL